MKCQLQAETGEVVEEVLDRGGVIDRLIPPVSDDTSACWRFIDPYGDTVFNTLQMGPFLLELDVFQRTATEQQALVLARLESMARRCRDDVHLYLKFIGD